MLWKFTCREESTSQSCFFNYAFFLVLNLTESTTFVSTELFAHRSNLHCFLLLKWTVQTLTALLTFGLAVLPTVPRTALPLQWCHYFMFDSVSLVCCCLGPVKWEQFKSVLGNQRGAVRYLHFVTLSHLSNPFITAWNSKWILTRVWCFISNHSFNTASSRLSAWILKKPDVSLDFFPEYLTQDSNTAIFYGRHYN